MGICIYVEIIYCWGGRGGNRGKGGDYNLLLIVSRGGRRIEY